MKRQIALDTETTGKGNDGDLVGDHRIIEIGCVEIVDRKLTGRSFQTYLNPQREVDEEATRVHGMTWQSLQSNPIFSQIAPQFIDFIRGSELLIHNARFDVSFLNHELAIAGINEKIEEMATVTDTIAVAHQYYPNHQVSLDALCRAFSIDASQRTLHGALLDAQLLAEVYLAMTASQNTFDLTIEQTTNEGQRWTRQQGTWLPIMSVEKERHAEHIFKMVELAQKKPSKNEQGQNLCVSSWNPQQLSFAALQKGEEEGKKDFAKRQQAQQQDETYKTLSRDECAALELFLDQHKQAHEAWLERVLSLHND